MLSAPWSAQLPPTCGRRHEHSRASRSSFADWWWTVDRVALPPCSALIGIGLMLAFAASPAATGGPLTEGDFHYAAKQIAFAAIAAVILGGASLLTPAQVKLAAALVFRAGACRLVPRAVRGQRGAGRAALDSISAGSLLQPSEFLKPGFAVLAAAMLADRAPTRLPKPAHHFHLDGARHRHSAACSPMSARPSCCWRCGRRCCSSPACPHMVGLIGGATAALARCGLFSLSPCASPRRAVPRSRPDTAIRRGWRCKAFAHGGLARRRPRRGHHQIPPARRAFRFHLCGGGRGVRPGAVRRHRAAVLRACRAPLAALGGGARSVLRSWRAPGLPSSCACRPSSIWAWR